MFAFAGGDAARNSRATVAARQAAYTDNLVAFFGEDPGT